ADAETHPEADAWQFELAPHLWIAEIDGSVTVRGRVRGEGQPEQTLSAAVSEGGLVGGSGRFEARKRRLTLFLDAMGAEADTVGDLGQIFGETTSGEVHSACLLSACRRQTCGTRARPNSAAGRRGRRRSAYEAPRAAADGGTRLGGAESKRRRRPRLPAPPSRVTLLD